MREYYRFDEDGYYVEPVITEGYFDSEGAEYTPEDLTEVRPPDGLYRGKFDKNKQEWVETGSPPEAQPPSIEQQISEIGNWFAWYDIKIIKHVSGRDILSDKDLQELNIEANQRAGQINELREKLREKTALG